MSRYPLIIALAAAAAVALAGHQPATTPDTSTTQELDEDGLPPRIEYAGELTHYCEGPHAVDVQPDTAQARAAADRWCLRADLALHRVDWPAGLTPVNDVVETSR